MKLSDIISDIISDVRTSNKREEEFNRFLSDYQNGHNFGKKKKSNEKGVFGLVWVSRYNFVGFLLGVAFAAMLGLEGADFFLVCYVTSAVVGMLHSVYSEEMAISAAAVRNIILSVYVAVVALILKFILPL